jgi:uncharacterized protein (TIGR02147 family)
MIFEFNDYKKYVEKRVSQMPKGGRGETQKIAKYLRMHSTRLSHVFRGQDHLTLEQGLDLCRYFGLNDLESEYFLALLQEAKAGSAHLQVFFRKKRQQIIEKSRQLSERVPGEHKLTDAEKALFYSNWYYSAIRLLCSLPGNHNVDSIAERFGLPRGRVSESLQFLLKQYLCVEKDGRLHMGPKSTHLEASSPIVTRLHSNWRIKAMEKHPALSPQELAFTSPMSIARKDAEKMREILVQAIERAVAFADTDAPDSLYCINVDLFEF